MFFIGFKKTGDIGMSSKKKDEKKKDKKGKSSNKKEKKKDGKKHKKHKQQKELAEPVASTLPAEETEQPQEPAPAEQDSHTEPMGEFFIPEADYSKVAGDPVWEHLWDGQSEFNPFSTPGSSYDDIIRDALIKNIKNRQVTPEATIVDVDNAICDKLNSENYEDVGHLQKVHALLEKIIVRKALGEAGYTIQYEKKYHRWAPLR